MTPGLERGRDHVCLPANIPVGDAPSYEEDASVLVAVEAPVASEIGKRRGIAADEDTVIGGRGD